VRVAPSASCPRCGAPRAPGPECPRCGVIYVKARPAPAALSSATPAARDPVTEGAGGARGPLPGTAPAVWRGGVDDARRELLIRAVSPPAALLAAWGLVSTGPGHALVRTFFSMWLHELGHAVVAWWSGHGAFPGPWRTPVSSGRVPLVVMALAAGLAALIWHGWRTGRSRWIALGVVGLMGQLACTLLPPGQARALFSFGGDAGCMVLGAALVATIWADPEGRLGRGSLRWGFLVIGACGLVDPLDTWVRAALDRGQLPLGEIEGVGLSDASALMEVHGWSAGALTGRYVAIGLGCLIALAIAYAVELLRARARVRAAEAAAVAGFG